MSAQHSPGPWLVVGHQVFGPLDDRSNYPCGRILIGGVVDDLRDWRAAPSEFPVEEGAEFAAETAANARLFAAAPELKDRLIELLDMLDGGAPLNTEPARTLLARIEKGAQS